MSFRNATTAAALALLLGGCMTAEPLRVEAPPTDELAVAAPRCPFVLAEVRDARASEDQGREGLHPVTIEDLPRLVERAVQATLGDRADARPVSLELLKAYADTRQVSRMYVLALRAHVGDDTFAVRGQSTGMFWSDGEGGVRRAAREALVNAMRELVKGLDARCEPGESTTTT